MSDDTVDLQAFLDLQERYNKLEHKFDKVLAISDKYQQLLESVSLSGHHTRTTTRSRGPLSPGADALVQRLKDHRDNDVQLLVRRFVKLQLQLAKIMSISDVYQTQLRESTLKLEKMARTDMLTELSNRRDMTEHLEMESLRSARTGRVFGIILFDIDFFKSVNDNYGHSAGDAVLITVGKVLRSELRGSDLCARWGGEEFLLLCPETDLDQTRAVAEKCRQAVESASVSTSGETIRVTVSGGVTALRPPCDRDWEMLVREADDALYLAKNRGRNRVEIAEAGCW